LNEDLTLSRESSAVNKATKTIALKRQIGVVSEKTANQLLVESPERCFEPEVDGIFIF